MSWLDARRPGIDKLVELGRVVARLVRARLRGRIDCVLFPAGGPHTVAIVRDLLLLPVARLVATRVILHVHAAGIHEKLAGSGRFFRCLVRRVYSACCHQAVVMTEFGRRDAASLGIATVSVVPNGVADTAGGPIVRASHDRPTLLSVGHVCPDKGTPSLVAAFGALARDFPATRLVIAGAPLPPYSEARLMADIEASGCRDQITWLGEVTGPALDDAYRTADIFVFSSVAPYESFGLVLAEAMQWSLPVVVTDWRANLDVATNEFGGVVAENPTTDLVTSLESALRTALESHDQWPHWGATNRTIFEARYTIHQFRQRLREVFVAW